jgi:NitT/TauT family transport system permease protein
VKKKHLQNILIAAVWLVLWYALDRLINNEILFVGPAATLRALARLLKTSEFYISVFSTLIRVALGFFLGAAAGIAMAVLGYRFHAVGAFISPFVRVIKSTPVASFVILLLIWAGNRNLSLIICFLVIFPVLYLNTYSGLRAVDEKMLEMARVFRISWRSRVRNIYIPALRPNLVSALSLALGMSWKSGVAAEVIGQPTHTIGNALYRSKIFFETADLFAWTIVIIALSWLFENGVRSVLRRSAGAARKDTAAAKMKS